MKREIDVEGIEQPNLSANLLAKIADTFERKLGRTCSEEDAAAWWDWIWPDFEIYWRQKKYRAVGRAILGWASRIRGYELDAALQAREVATNLALEKEQRALNEAASNVTQIDYFARLGRSR